MDWLNVRINIKLLGVRILRVIIVLCAQTTKSMHRPQDHKTFFFFFFFFCSTQLSMKFVLLINLKLLTIANSFLLIIAEHENFSANKYENVGIFIFISRENFMLSWVEHEVKSFINSGPHCWFALSLFRNAIVKATYRLYSDHLR